MNTDRDWEFTIQDPKLVLTLDTHVPQALLLGRFLGGGDDLHVASRYYGDSTLLGIQSCIAVNDEPGRARLLVGAGARGGARAGRFHECENPSQRYRPNQDDHQRQHPNLVARRQIFQNTLADDLLANDHQGAYGDASDPGRVTEGFEQRTLHHPSSLSNRLAPRSSRCAQSVPLLSIFATKLSAAFE